MKSNFYAQIKLVVLFVAVLPALTHAQNTFTQVYQILQTNCAGSSCHDGVSPTFNATLGETALYNALLNVTPVNPAAAAKLNKLVVPGDVGRSFLLRKIAHGISSGLALTQPQEGEDMPKGLPALDSNQIELVRQWILFGAPLTGNVVDTALINTYYRNGGVDDTYSPHIPPASNQGFQIYLGKIFIPANTEKEYFLKYNPHLDAPVEVPHLVTMMPTTAHHYVMYSFLPGQDAGYPEGLRGLNQTSMPSVTNGIGSGPGLQDYELPQGTAYFFDQGLIFDLNLHIKNPSGSILATDLYMNVYTQPLGTAQHYMQIRNFLGLDISIPQDGQEHAFTLTAADSSLTKSWKIWKLYSHTHRYGTGYDAWLRNANGTKGEHIYDGDYSYEQNYMVGYYRWGVDVTVRTFPDDSLREVNPLLGFIHEARYKNTAGPDPVNWGDTSLDEMMVLGFQFIYGDDIANDVPDLEKKERMRIYPNPSRNGFAVSYTLDETQTVQIDLFNILGAKIGSLVHEQKSKGSQTQNFSAAGLGLSSGVYLIRTTIGNETATEKLTITE